MSRFTQHHTHSSSAAKWVFLTSCACLLGGALVADFLWASSSYSFSAYSFISSNLALDKSGTLVVPNVTANEAGQKGSFKDEKERASERFLSGTFADIAAPELPWEKMTPAPVPRLDGSSIQIKNIFYVFAGYGTIDYVHSHVDIYNFTDNTWGERLDIPKEMAHSHLGVATDGRYIYVVSGQYGPQCRGPTARIFVLDTETKKWSSMLPLPSPRACVVMNDRLFLIGGQEGDFMPKPGSPIFKCSRRHEVVYGDAYMLDGEMKWKVLPPMPKPNSHIECSWVIVNNSIIIAGGTTEKNPVTKRMILVGEVFRFQVDSMTWSVIGRLPYRVKTTLTGFWNGYLYFTSGQRDRGPDNPQPRQVVGDMFRTKLNL
ncbi:kelch repeat-containing protein At3g27220-like isoform X2 [Prunus avium]|uniref:Kelch repeat-containing protein At3g27220-like isoform X2 n=1 Tax=Prunus avium TaxID=42229 RepID=A0A6P5U1P1_PRUAV|nr:kelch repeat-containing protein At3g27220-like isoform X2 [Prunus avium]